MQFVRWTAAVLAGLLIAGCTSAPGPAGSTDSPAQPDPEFIDHTGMVADWSFEFQDTASPDEFASNSGVKRDSYDGDYSRAIAYVALYAPPGEWDARVVWYASACTLSPRVQAFGAGGRIEVIAVDVGPDVASSEPDGEAACPSVGLYHAIDLKTAARLDEVVIVALNAPSGVDDWAFHTDLDAPPDGATTHRPRFAKAPAGWDARIVWGALPCQRRHYASVQVGNRDSFDLTPPTDAADEVRSIRLRVGPRLADGSECDARPTWRFIDLKLSLPLAHDAAVQQVSD